jgi:hypothetical protein
MITLDPETENVIDRKKINERTDSEPVSGVVNHLSRSYGTGTKLYYHYY